MSDKAAFRPDRMRDRFHALGNQREAILAKSTPLRAARDKLQQETEAKVAKMNQDIKAAETGLFDIDVERGALCRALGGKTGTPK